MEKLVRTIEYSTAHEKKVAKCKNIIKNNKTISELLKVSEDTDYETKLYKIKKLVNIYKSMLKYPEGVHPMGADILATIVDIIRETSVIIDEKPDKILKKYAVSYDTISEIFEIDKEDIKMLHRQYKSELQKATVVLTVDELLVQKAKEMGIEKIQNEYQEVRTRCKKHNSLSTESLLYNQMLILEKQLAHILIKLLELDVSKMQKRVYKSDLSRALNISINIVQSITKNYADGLYDNISLEDTDNVVSVQLVIPEHKRKAVKYNFMKYQENLKTRKRDAKTLADRKSYMITLGCILSEFIIDNIDDKYKISYAEIARAFNIKDLDNKKVRFFITKINELRSRINIKSNVPNRIRGEIDVLEQLFDDKFGEK